MPKVSVLMPIYKTNERYLREAIESILNQSFTDFEFLILDDCPENSREEIVKLYKDDRIKYFKNERNLGISHSRNKLIDLASGEYLAVFDHDDVSLPKRFERQVKYLDEHPDVGVVGAKSKTIINGRTSKFPTNDHEIKMALMRECVVLHPSSMIRKSVLIDNDIRYEESFSPSEDYALWCNLIKHTKFHNINDEVLFMYRDHEENTTHIQSEKMKQTFAAVQFRVKTQNPMLYEEFLLRAKHTVRIKLFNFIPLVTIKTEWDMTRWYLFDAIPLWSVKTVIRIQELN